ncbi:hypothetical protein Fleli_3243 [Bernardetia litoralis DSM 6794]|uniref:Uncharacterized protein n=1 Tax=Bernardetia litoralis (strain ATCC 23117 / DSM 6794 / NBRC 15988 / NCIMB 1366 / Fx l1 / Sio-4) TaxID=880071 RepID=I4ANN9_BERLS|nr:hypothetical protein Fleli_3243 [Bernardetia litoralis DSM 6794]
MLYLRKIVLIPQTKHKTFLNQNSLDYFTNNSDFIIFVFHSQL